MANLGGRLALHEVPVELGEQRPDIGGRVGQLLADLGGIGALLCVGARGGASGRAGLCRLRVVVGATLRLLLTVARAPDRPRGRRCQWGRRPLLPSIRRVDLRQPARHVDRRLLRVGARA